MKKTLSLILTAALSLTASAQQTIIEGDMNHDGKLTIEDVTLLTENLLTNVISAYTLKGDVKYLPDVVEHEYVDLALPSGTGWATCNVGANAPEQFGDYFAWGESRTQRTHEFSWTSYKYGNSSTTLTKYCYEGERGLDGFTDALTVLEPDDDAAASRWGDGWRMPTYDEIDELLNPEYTTSTWTMQKGVGGYLITSKENGNSIFLPAAGYYRNGNLTANNGSYWLGELGANGSYVGRTLYFTESQKAKTTTSSRFFGYSVRPVKVKKVTSHPYVDLGTGVLWATCNLGASSPEEFGNYYAWGETAAMGEAPTDYPADFGGYKNPNYMNLSTKTTFTDENYKYYKEKRAGEYEDEEVIIYSKYNDSDGKTLLDPADDAAVANWGSDWRMPTWEEFDALFYECFWQWVTSYNGKNVHGFIVYKAKDEADKGCMDYYDTPVASYSIEDPHIFLPAAGSYWDGSFDPGLDHDHKFGNYWYANYCPQLYSEGYYILFTFDMSNVTNDRTSGCSIRPVRPYQK